MKIKETKSGEAYQLQPGTKLEIQRTNLFFNEFGEQSLPVSLPASPHNLRLLGYPDRLSRRQKVSTDIEATIEDGGFYSVARQAVLGVNRNDVSTSFYLNEGSLLAKIGKTQLAFIFQDEFIPGVTTVDEGISFCEGLIAGNDPHYGICDVLIDCETSTEGDKETYHHLNFYGEFDGVKSFYNKIEREEKDGEKTITIPKGCYMTPFIRTNYLLQRIFQFYGYTLKENFFTRTMPFNKMLVLNNTADALLNGKIKVADLLPDCTAATFLNVMRKKFCCEFFVDEGHKVVDIQLFRDIIRRTPDTDLTPFLMSGLEVSFPEEYKSLVISSEHHVDTQKGIDNNISIKALLEKFGAVYYNASSGAFTRQGAWYHASDFSSDPILLNETVATSAFAYNPGETQHTHEVKVPDLQPEMRSLSGTLCLYLYIGASRFLNSKIVAKGGPTENEEMENSDEKTFPPCLAFPYLPDYGYPMGTLTGAAESYDGFSPAYKKLWPYSLCYWGEDSIYERFYRDLDEIYRNSMHRIKASLLLTPALRFALKAELPVLLHGQPLLINSLNYIIGRENEPCTVELMTVRSHQPSTHGVSYDVLVSGVWNPVTRKGYKWVSRSSKKEISQSQFDPTRTVPPASVVYLKDYPSAAQVGKEVRKQTWHYEDKPFVGIGSRYYEITAWITCQYVDDTV